MFSLAGLRRILLSNPFRSSKDQHSEDTRMGFEVCKVPQGEACNCTAQLSKPVPEFQDKPLILEKIVPFWGSPFRMLNMKRIKQNMELRWRLQVDPTTSKIMKP